MRELTREEGEIAERLACEGFSFDKEISISSICKTNPELHGFLLKKAKQTGRKSNISKLLNHIGFTTMHAPDILDKFKEELKTIYTPEKIEDAVNNGATLPNTKELRKISKYAMRYNARIKTNKLPSLRTLLNSLYPNYPDLSLYVTNKVELSDFSAIEVRNMLREMYYRGEDISSSGLKEMPGAFLWRWLTVYSREKRKKHNAARLIDAHEQTENRKRDVTKVIQRLTKIRQANFSIKGSHKTKRLGNISENLAKIVLWAAHALDPTGEMQTEEFRKSYPLPIAGIYPIAGKSNEPRGINLKYVPEEHRDPKIFSDIVVKSQKEVGMVEVKNLRRAPKNALADIKERFINSGRELYWVKEGRKITRKTIVCQTKQNVYEQISKILSGTDVNVVSPPEFRKSLEIALHQLDCSGYVRSHVYSVDELLKMYDLVAESPHILIRKSHEYQFDFLETITQELIERMQNGKRPEKSEIEIYSTNGKLAKNERGELLLFNISLKDLPDLKIKDYIMKRIDKIPDRTLFADIESTGWVGKLIFLVGTAHKLEDDLRIELIFARNPFEEDAMLLHFYEKTKRYNEIVTYNGRTFDYPALDERLVGNMMPYELPQKHSDLYNIMCLSGTRKRHNLKSLKLHKLYELFGDKREDVMGCEIPLLYSNWALNGQPRVIEKDIEHNILDLVTMAALYLSPDLLHSKNSH